MKKVLYITLAILFFAAGIVGLALPVIPQVPFFIACAICIMHVSKKFDRWVKKQPLYRDHVETMALKNKYLAKALQTAP